MQVSRSAPSGTQTKVVVLTADDGFEEQARATFGASPKITLDVIKGTLASRVADANFEGASVVVADVNGDDEAEMHALARLMERIGSWPPVVAVAQTLDANVARRLMQMRVSDFLVKPVTPVELVKNCARVAKAPGNAETTEAQIVT